MIEARVERRRAAAPVVEVQLGVSFRIRAQPVKPLQRLRHHVLSGVPPRELRRGGDVEEERLLQGQLELRVWQAADRARRERRKHGLGSRGPGGGRSGGGAGDHPAPPATLKYVASG